PLKDWVRAHGNPMAGGQRSPGPLCSVFVPITGTPMRPHLLALALAAALAGCQPADAPTNATAAAASEQAGDPAVDAAFADLSRRALDTWMQLSPVSATQIGDHRHDSEIDDLSAAGQQK